MEAVDLIGLLVFGFAAGMAGGLVGVGGGVIFVPALVLFADESQLGAQATSLVAIVLVSLVGTWRQRELRQRPAARRPPDRRAVADRGARREWLSPTSFPSARWSCRSRRSSSLFAWQLAGKAGLR